MVLSFLTVFSVAIDDFTSQLIHCLGKQSVHDVTGMNAKRNPQIGNLANNVLIAISQEKKINQDIHNCKGLVTSNIGHIIEKIMKEKPNI